MASIIAGYLYDIFISYRQKENKHDGWVQKPESMTNSSRSEIQKYKLNNNRPLH